MARATMVELAKKVKDLVIVGECKDAVEAYNLLREEVVDLLLLDIEMPGMTGLDLIKNMGNKRPVIVFITSKKEYALEAFELNVADYLLKPAPVTRFIQAIDKAREILDSKKEDVTIESDEFIFVRDSSIIRRLKLDNILFAEAMGDYVKLHTPERFYAIHTTLGAVEERLPAAKFVRVHRSYIIALSKIDSIQDGVLVINGKSLPVADSFRKKLNARMNVL
jgi:DNA-binding LytR/AlgR family response regulator